MSHCHTCGIALVDETALRDHYRSSLHQVNLKRRVADLPPVSAESFDRHLAAEAERKEKEALESAACVYICDACHKSYDSEGQFETHIRTKKHVARVRELLAERKAQAEAAKTGAVAEAGSGSSDAAVDAALPSGASGVSAEARRPLPAAGLVGVAESKTREADDGDEDGEAAAAEEGVLTVSVTNCLFCFADGGDVEGNLEHMRSVHSFHVPDADFLIDREGLLEHLMAKVVEGRCLACKSDSAFTSPQAAQQHMVAKAHCRMPYECEAHFEEYSDFYDYAGETDSEDDDDDGDDGEERADRIVVSGPANDVTLTGSGDLVLKKGRVARPRHLMRYYKQRLGELTEPPAPLRATLARLALEYEAAGGDAAAAGGSGGKPAASLAHMRALAALGTGTRGNLTDVRGQRREAAYRRQEELRTGLGMNEIRRKYFRVQLLV